MTAPDARFASALAERYRFEGELGAGGMATVYLAADLRLQRPVAVKVLRPDLAATVGAERFLREVTTTANLRHPSILPLFDSGEAAGYLYYVMPFVEGKSLRDRLRRESPLPTDEALRIADEVAEALHYAHGRGVVHRDVKPENILLENGRAVIADFGIAHVVHGAGDEKLTMTGMSLGTPHYMSPEQVTGEGVDGRSDLYALGCILFEMLTGAPPFSGPNPMAIMMRHVMDPVPSLAHVRPAVAAHVTAAIERALAKQAGDRFPSVAEWRDALRPTAEAGTLGTVSTGPVPILKAPPAPPTAQLGRDEQLAAAMAQLETGTPILTVTGVGGTGKMRFAIEMFRRARGRYACGAAFVSLASVTDASDVLPTISATLDITEAHGARLQLDSGGKREGNVTTMRPPVHTPSGCPRWSTPATSS